MALSLQELGAQIQAARNHKGWTQEDLAARLSPRVNRSQIAHLEQGRRIPSDVEAFREICQGLGVPQRYWSPFTEPDFRTRLEFEEAISELVGHVATLAFVDEQIERVASDQVSAFFAKTRNEEQTLDALNSLLVFYGAVPMTAPFFRRYFQVESAKTPKAFLGAVRKFQAEAIRLFSTFDEAYRTMNGGPGLEELLRPLEPRKVNSYHNREPARDIEDVPEQRLADLGYISAKKANKEKQDRQLLAEFLRELADKLER